MTENARQPKTEPDVSLGLNEAKTPERMELERNLKNYKPSPTDKKLIDPKVTPPFEMFCDEESGTFKPAKLAAILKNQYEIMTDILTDTLYFYHRGLWDKNGDAYLRSIITTVLGENSNPHRTQSTIFETHSQTLSALPKSSLIAVENGLLNPKTGELQDFAPKEFVTAKIPVRYDKNANCPANTKFLNEVLEPDQIPIVEELFGYCLLQELPIHTSAVLLGEGANGKSTLLNVLNAFLGPENVSHATLQQLCEGKFELAQLYGKLANICDDLPGDALKSVGNFKNLTGDAPILAQHKRKDPFTFLNTAKMFWACNKLPPSSEDTTAYYRRFIILNFNRVFTGQSADIHLKEKLTTPEELSGLLNLSLKALKRLLENNSFSNAKSIEETRQQYIRTADSCQAYIEEITEVSDEQKDIVREDENYNRYIAYCSFHKLPKQRKANLTIAMQKYRPEAQRSQIRLGKKPVRVWQYLKLKEGVTGVTTVTGVLFFGKSSENQNIIKKK